MVEPHNSVEVVLGDSREILPTLPDHSFNVMFADPPWGVPHFSRGRPFYDPGREQGHGYHLNDRDQEQTFETYVWLIRQAARLLDSHGSLYLMAGNNLLSPILDDLCSLGYRFRICVWVKPNAMPARPGIPYRNAVEYIVHAYRKVDIKRRYRPSANNYWIGYWVPNSQRVVSTQKPVGMLQHFIGATPGRLLDPFCGSGASLVAAQRLGLDALGIDNDAECVDHTRHRVKTDPEVGYY